MNRCITTFCTASLMLAALSAWATGYPGYICTPLATFPTNIYGTLVDSYGESLLPNGEVIGMAEDQSPGTPPPFPVTELVAWNSDGSKNTVVDYGIWGHIDNTLGDASGRLALNGETAFYIYSGGTATAVPQLAGGGNVIGGMSSTGLIGGYNGNGGFAYDAATSQYYSVGGSDGWVNNAGNGCAVGGYWNGSTTEGLFWTESTQATSYIPSLFSGNGISGNNILVAGLNAAGTNAAVYNTSTHATTAYWSGEATGVNDSGLVIGDNSNVVSDNAGAPWNCRAMACINGQTVDLTTAYAQTGVTFNMAVAVNDAGDILVWSEGYQSVTTSVTSYLLTPALPGDANLDGKVDINDLTIVLAHYGQTGATWSTGDFIGDGTVDINDLTIVLAHYGDSTGSAAGGIAGVPEPAGLLLSATALAGLAAYGWRKRRS